MIKQDHNPGIASLLYRHSPRLLFLAIFVGALAGALYSCIIPFVLRGINSNLHPVMGSSATLQFIDKNYVSVFFVICFLILITKSLSVILINNIAKQATANLRIAIAKKINALSIAKLESLGYSRLITILIDDVNALSAAAIAIPMILVASLTVCGILVYLALLNLKIFAIVLAAIILGATAFQLPSTIAAGFYERARSLKDSFQAGVTGLVFGAYELKLDQDKAKRYIHEEIVNPQQATVAIEKTADSIIHLAGAVSDLLLFFTIGFVAFILPQYVSYAQADTYGVVMALLYMVGPLAQILGLVQQLKVGGVALRRIGALQQNPSEIVTRNPGHMFESWQEYSAQGVSYTYMSEDGKQRSSLNRTDISFKRGNIYFIVGGNGSGKTTLSKLLSLHYHPEQGGIYFDNQLITENNIINARERISVIFSNYHLFEKLYKPVPQEDYQKITQYLGYLGLSDCTRLEDGRFSTTKLSDGQRRRLALLVALLDDKEIYILDEWAADQDPVFKKIFYETILKEMKRDNKTIIVITHDEKYFAAADSIIFMEDAGVTHIQEAPDFASYAKHSDASLTNKQLATADSSCV